MVEENPRSEVMNAGSREFVNKVTEILINKYRNTFELYWHHLSSSISLHPETREGLKKGISEMEEHGYIMHKFTRAVEQMLKDGKELSLPEFLKRDFCNVAQSFIVTSKDEPETGSSIFIFEGNQIALKLVFEEDAEEPSSATLIPVGNL